MIEVKTMTSNEVEDFLNRVNYGHLGCSSDNHPYVLPIHFAYDRQTIYIYTTEGKKSEMIDSNSEICLQVEKVVDNENWVSVIVVGDAKRLANAADREEAYASIAATNPTLTPALSYRWLDRQRRPIVKDGLRSPLPRPIEPGESCHVALRLKAPETAGEYLLELDLVEEGVTWFSEVGVPPLRVRVDVRR